MRKAVFAAGAILLVVGCLEPTPDETPCAEGTRGCPCLSGDIACLDAGLLCNPDNLCVDVECPPGGSGCSCRIGAEPCDGVLECLNNRCQLGEGLQGGPCLEGGRCAGGFSCENNTCVPCSQGQRRCDCFADGSCDSGLACVGGWCLRQPSEVLPRPEDPRCYTPCSASTQSLTDGYLRCPASGLLPGCVGGRRCSDGSCVRGDEEPRACNDDAGCPDFQACLEGLCMANCESHSDCDLGLECHRKVCRIACRTNEIACPGGQTCISADGENGYCMPLVPEDRAAQTEQVGGFEVEEAVLEFSNIKTRDSLTLVNNGTEDIMLQLRVKYERVRNAGGGVKYMTSSPLPWLRINTEGDCSAGSQAPPFTVRVPAEERLKVWVCNADAAERDAWMGAIEVSHANLGSRSVDLSYAERPDGQWRGRMVYLANFEDAGLADWVAAGRVDGAPLRAVRNALLRRWGDFKYGRISLNEWWAVLQATETESWSWPSARQRCASSTPGGACYLFDNIDGYSTYTASSDEVPVPSGVLALPFVMNIRQQGEASGNCSEVRFTGRIDTAGTLQYPGNPRVDLSFLGLNASCGRNPLDSRLIEVVDFSSTAHVGGRYRSDLMGCAQNDGFVLHRTPWLVPGFTAQTILNGEQRYREECRSSAVPFTVGDDAQALNLSLAASNPIPDGRARRRVLQFIDGALVDGTTLMVFFQERFEGVAITEDEDFSGYGYMVLQRNAQDLSGSDFIGTAPEYVNNTSSKLGVVCAPELLNDILGPQVSLNTSTAEEAVGQLLRGPGDVGAAPIDASSREQVHYLCMDAEGQSTFSGMPGSDEARVCPPDSTVVFFTQSGVDGAEVANHPCNEGGICMDAFNQWAADGYGSLRVDPLYACSNIDTCEGNRRDLRQGRTFYEAGTAQDLLPLSSQVEAAFAYKMRFRSREGLNTGFTPKICRQSGGGIPYCYDPGAIEVIQARVDCALSIYDSPVLYSALDQNTQNKLRFFLRNNFSFESAQNLSSGRLIKREGFDYLNTELWIMLGDEAYASAFASRFDVAASAVYGFEGSLFEPGGIDLSGVAGYEMFRLYQAAQYYQLSLDRFYALSPHLQQSGDKRLILLATVSTYFSRLIRASSQRVRVWGDIALRYHNMNRPQLARQVVERVYSGASIESTLLVQMMRGVLRDTLPQERAQIERSINEAQRRYRAELLRMRTIYADLSGGLNVFGFADDYIPFPGLEADEGSALRKIRGLALQKLQLAIEREDQALQSNRAYETDKQNFQSELTRIRTTYENRLAEICGTFTGDDAGVYPATTTYAYLNEDAALLGDPCGYMGTGALFTARLRVLQSRVDIESSRQQYDNVLADIDIEMTRVAAQCDVNEEQVQFRLGQDNKSNTLQGQINASRNSVDDMRFSQQKAAASAGIVSACTPSLSFGGSGPSVSLSPGACIGAVMIQQSTSSDGARIKAAENAIRTQEQRLRALQQATMRWELGKQCDVAEIDSTARVRSLSLRLAEIEIAALRLRYQVLVAQAEESSLRNEVKRVLAEQGEAEQMAMDVAAARNDPNVRIYKNDAILAADRTFKAALRQAYRATRIFEYYSGQSYAELNELFLVRMALRGTPNLEAYLYRLFDAYDDFAEQYGSPDVRVAVISMRDDVMGIPRLNEDGRTLSHTDRVGLFRGRLLDGRLLDTRGYVLTPFSTRADVVSPLTKNHKILYMEAELVGMNTGDNLGRVYLTQAGTSSVLSIANKTLFYAFPKRTAVMNTYFNGRKVFAPQVYRSYRLRDRPLLNTRWELAFNQRDEEVNQDIDLASLSDIRLIVYYTDFTPL